MKQVLKVARVASWDGWCSPCEREDRPLSLTVNGPGGLRSWLTGHDNEDRWLVLTCRVCGEWQVVPWNEEDDPEVVLVEDDELEAVTALLHDARHAEAAAPEVDVVAADPVAQAALRAVIEAELRAAAVAEAEAAELTAVQPPAAEAALPAAEAPAAPAPADPGPRSPDRIMLRGLTHSSPAVSARTRSATEEVLSAARAAERAATPQRTPRPRPAAAAVAVPQPRAATPPPAPTSVALPSSTVLDMLAAGHQVVLVPAS